MKYFLFAFFLTYFFSCKKEATNIQPVNPCVDRCPYLGEWTWTDSASHQVSIRQASDTNAIVLLIPYSTTWIRATAIVSWQELYVLGQYLYTDSMINEINNGYVWFENKDTNHLHI